MTDLTVRETIQEPLLVRVRRWATSASGITILATLAVLIVATIDKGPSLLVNTIVTGGMWALLSVGLALVFGVMNIPNFAHGEFFLAGSYTAFFVYTPIRAYLRENPSPLLENLAPFVAIIAAALVGLVLGAVLEVLVFRQLRQRNREQWVMNSFLLTVGIAVILINGSQILWGANFKGIPNYWAASPIRVAGVPISIDRVVAFAIAVVTILAFWYFMQRTQTGRAIRAVAQDEKGAQMVGISLNRILLLTLALSGALAAMAGASLLFVFAAYPSAGLRPLYVAWYVVILVGLGNVSGAVVGGFIVALLQDLTTSYVGQGWYDVIPTALIILILIFKPSGLFGSDVKGVHEQ